MRRRAIGSLLLVFFCAAGAFCTGQARQEQPATAPALSPEQLGFARRPISYFNQECGACHGNYGSFWGEGFAAALDDKALREVVDEMAAGPSQMPLEGLALDVQVAYHRSLVDGKPFVTAYLEEGKLRGEVTPGSEVVLIVDGKEQPATVEKHTWRSEARTEAGSAVRARKDGRTTELALDIRQAEQQVQFTHEAPGGELSLAEPAATRRDGRRFHTVQGIESVAVKNAAVKPGINYQWARTNGHEITPANLQRLMASARPVAPDDKIIDEWHYAPWCSASFMSGGETWSVAFYLGGLGFISDETGRTGAFCFEPPAVQPGN